MKFIHVSDTHLGAAPYGLIDRERDIYEAFKEVADIAIAHKVDAVLHAGDMFHDSNPKAAAYLSAFKHLSRLRSNGIDFYVVAGNHETIKATGVSPLRVLEALDLARVLSDSSTPGSVVFEDGSGLRVEIVGFSHKAFDRLFIDRLSGRDGVDVRVALAHTILCDAASIVMKISESRCREDISGSAYTINIPKGYSYIALGDLHKNWEGRTRYGAPVIYPGSTEALNVSEYMDKRYVYLVELDRGYVDYRRVELKSPRPWIIIDAGTAREVIERLNSVSWGVFSKEPIVYITVKGDLSRIDKDRIVSLLNSLRSEGKILYYRGPLTAGRDVDSGYLAIEPKEDYTSVDIEDVVKNIFPEDASRYIVDIVEGLDEDSIISRLVEDRELLDKLYKRFSGVRRLDDY